MSDVAGLQTSPLRLPRMPIAADTGLAAIDGPAAWLQAQYRRALGPVSRLRAFHAARQVALLELSYRSLSAEAFSTRRLELVATLRRGRHSNAAIIEVIALVREACRREMGLLPHLEQIAGAHALLHGTTVEMDTGEGKTITAAMAAAMLGLQGRSVHVVTSNDYLAERDAAGLRPFFAALGLDSATVLHDMPYDVRRVAYGADVTYVSNKEVAFDYLRDGLLRGGTSDAFGRFSGQPQEEPVQRGLDVAIVDEIDSVLIDDAGTPLLISAPAGDELGIDVLTSGADMVSRLQEERDYVRDIQGMGIRITPAGQRQIESLTDGMQGIWRQRISRDEIVRAALTAIHTLERDRHYLVRDGKVVIVDQTSGRTMPDRFWSNHIHAFVEWKEGLEVSGERRSLASISFQRFFRNYRMLCGMSGTIREVASELNVVYRIPSTRIRRHLPLRRSVEPRKMFAERDTLWRQVATDANALSVAGRPVLIGVRTVGEAERASAALRDQGLSHRVLSAAQDRDEAEAVANAGQPGMVTIATNMAGRGTDIRLAQGVSELGGLAVMLCERHESRRVDRQLFGRCARQGDRGSSVEYLSTEDDILDRAHPFWRWLMLWPIATQRLAALAFASAQGRTEGMQAQLRADLVRRDSALQKILAFAGGLD